MLNATMSEAPGEANRSTISEYIKRFREQPPAPLSQRKTIGGREKFWWLPAEQQASAAASHHDDDQSRTNFSEHDDHVGYYDDASLPELPSLTDNTPATTGYAGNNWLDLSLSHIRDSQSSQADKHLLGGSFDFDAKDLYVDDVTRLADQLVQKCESLLNQHSPAGPSHDGDQPAGSVRSSIQSSLLHSVQSSAPSSVQSSLQSVSPSQMSIDPSSSDDLLKSSGPPLLRGRDAPVGVLQMPVGPLIDFDPTDHHFDHYQQDQGREGERGNSVLESCASDHENGADSASDSDSDSSSFMFISPSTSCASSVHHVRDCHLHQSLGDGYRSYDEPAVPAKARAAAPTTPGGGSMAIAEMQEELQCRAEDHLYETYGLADTGTTAPLQAPPAQALPVPPGPPPVPMALSVVAGGVDEASVRAYLGDPVLARLWARLQEVRASIRCLQGEGRGEDQCTVTHQPATSASAARSVHV